MESLSYMRSVVDRNVVMRRMSVFILQTMGKVSKDVRCNIPSRQITA